MLPLHLSNIVLFTYWVTLALGSSLKAGKRGFECITASSASRTDNQPSKMALSQNEYIYDCRKHFDDIFLNKFRDDTGIEANTIDWNCLRGCFPAGFVFPAEDWSLHKMRAMVRYYYRVHFFIPLDEELGNHFEDGCARLCEPPLLDVPFSPEMLKFTTDKEGYDFALAFDLAHFKEGLKSESSKCPENHEPAREPAHASTSEPHLKDVQKNLAKALLKKYRMNTANFKHESIPWTSCSIVGLPACIDLLDVEQVCWVLRNIYRFRFFSPSQIWMSDMFSQDLTKIHSLEQPSSDVVAASSQPPGDRDPLGMLLEHHYNSVIYLLTLPNLAGIPHNCIFSIGNGTRDNAIRKDLIKFAVTILHSKLLKEINVNSKVCAPLKAIIVGLPFFVTLAMWETWTASDFQTFLAYYYRIRAFPRRRTRLAVEYAAKVKALPPPPFVDTFAIVNGELIVGPNSDTEGLLLQQEWNSAAATAMHSNADGDSAGLNASTTLVRVPDISSSWFKLNAAFNLIFLRKFKHETGRDVDKIDWNSQLHAGYPIDPFEDHLVYFTEHGMRLFLKHLHRIRFFPDDQKEVHADYVKRLASLPPPPLLHFELPRTILSSHRDAHGLALQAEFDQRLDVL